MPLPIPNSILEDLNIEFVLGLLRIKNGTNLIMVVVDHLFKMAYFIACKKMFDANSINKLFFKEILYLYGVLRSLVLDQDTKFVNYFWK